jgi:Protein of unknown function (DUF2934)
MSHHHRDTLATSTHPGEIKPTSTAASATLGSANNRKTISEEEIRLRAYRKWERAGKPGGDGVQFWLEARQELEQAK